MQKLKPALMLPAGEKDWRKRVAFMENLTAKLSSLGWTMGVELKGGTLGIWAEECCGIVNRLGGRIVWHLPWHATCGLGSKDNIRALTMLIRMLSRAKYLHKVFGLEAVVLHPAPAIVRTKKPAKNNERYFSPIGPEEYLKQLHRQAGALKAINEQSDGLICLENMDICSFSEGGYTLPTYLGLQAGSWLDLVWLSKETGCRTVFDSEHFFGSRNFLLRNHEFGSGFGLDWPPAQTAGEKCCEEITGYVLRHGEPPFILKFPNREVGLVDVPNYLDKIKPSHFHIGGADKAFTHKGELACHLPFSNLDELSNKLSSEVIEAIKMVITRLNAGQGIGAVIEVCGQNVPGPYSPWSPRIIDDEVAKMQTYLAVMNEIEVLQRTN